MRLMRVPGPRSSRPVRLLLAAGTSRPLLLLLLLPVEFSALLMVTLIVARGW